MTNPFGLAPVRSGNDIVHWAQLLLNRMWAMVFGMQGLPWHGRQLQDLITRLEGAKVRTAVVPNYGLGPFLRSMGACKIQGMAKPLMIIQNELNYILLRSAQISLLQPSRLY